MLEINSSKNSIIKETKSLSRKKNRWNDKLFIIEGIKTIAEAIKSSAKIKHIFYSEILFSTEDGLAFFQEIKNKNQTIKLSEAIFKEITDLENPQGVIAVVEFIDRDIEEIYNKDLSFILFLDELNDPGNLGTIIRTADAFNIEAIILGRGCVDPYNSKVVRSTMGSIFRVPIYNLKDNDSFFETIKKKGVKIMTTSLEGNLLSQQDFKDRNLVVIGNEANGVSKSIVELSDKEIKIPMPGSAESLNAGVAASIIMYEAMINRNNLLKTL